jgi:glyoxylase-like metal-dependent hydrolase (beta-lactamase superfamily II)
MIGRLLAPDLLQTGPVRDRILAIRHGFVNSFVVLAPGGLLCIDAGWDPSRVELAFGRLGLDRREVAAVFLTHAHWDHARGATLFPQADIFVGEREAPARGLARRARPRCSRRWLRLRDGHVLTAAGATVQVFETPGHTPGSVSYVVEGRFLFTGDAVALRRGEAFPRRSLRRGDSAAGERSIRRLAGLAGLECLLTAHTGATADPAGAFRRWRDTPQGKPAPRAGAR